MHPSKTTVLLAEGASAMRQALASQLQTFGFGQVLQARDGARALQLLRAEPVHVVICDLDMQGLDGLAVLEAMRAEPKLAGLPFILMSGGLDRDSAARAIRLGIGDLLVKPFTVRRLIERMQRVLQRDAPAPLRTGAPDEHPPLEPVPEPERATILVVDDTPDNLQLLAGLFRDRFKVKIAHNGEKALAICQSDAPPDLILLDVMMPGMDGFEVARRLREHHASECTPIIFVTAMTDDASRHQGLSLGAIDYVFKPIEPELLHLRVSNLMYYVEHRKQLQKDFDQMHENSRLQAELERMRVELQRLRGG
ncbi:response regulator containing a CheY-like receiver domain and a GGDEF domain [Acidovorax sp. CF316]|uniref:response regulator n=1 Tax=Acidovorax sp. CF316 TaxID=1144317 RepID=UPI00026BDFA0|nr:response regulator [Acidovorax sp. CF316]EJE49384.1 response regulator containing a CheY-like receiver domain and a GGDEF domain [Acidovorax sp. CF316]